MRSPIIIPVRSGITNSVTWLFVEVFVGYIIDRLLITLYNWKTVRSLAQGTRLEIRESCVPLFGAGLFARHRLSLLIICTRIAISLAFLTMNLGIDGVEIPNYERRTFESHLARGTGCNNNRVSHVGWAIAKCIRYSPDLATFNVTSPVFNLTKRSNQFYVDEKTLVCRDGKETRDNDVLVKGRTIRSLELRRDLGLKGHFVLDAENQHILGSQVVSSGAVLKLTGMRRATDKSSVFTNGNLRSYCASRQQLRIQESAHQGQAFACFFVYEIDGLMYLFTSITVELHQRSKGVVSKLRFSDALVITATRTRELTQSLTLEDNDVRSITDIVLNEGSKLYGLLPTVLTCRLDATIPVRGEDYHVALIAKEEKTATKVQLYSLIIAATVLLLAALLAVLVCCGWLFRNNHARNSHVNINTIDGLSRLLAVKSTGSTMVGRNARANVSFDGSNVIQVSASRDIWGIDSMPS